MEYLRWGRETKGLYGTVGAVLRGGEMIELNKIYNEDCLDTMKRMDDNSIDLTITSPPYDNLRDYNGFSFDFESIAKELFRVTKKGGVIIWIVGDATINGSETGTSFRQALYFKEIGFNLHDTMIYNKLSRYPSSGRYSQSFEYMFIISKCNPNTFNPVVKQLKTVIPKINKISSTYRDKNGKLCVLNNKYKLKILDAQNNKYKLSENIWYIPAGHMTSSQDKIAYEHPAVFPEKLIYYQLLSWSNEESLIYDPFMGSGTTAKIAHLLNRNWIGSEISKEYCDIAEKRIDPYLRQGRLF